MARTDCFSKILPAGIRVGWRALGPAFEAHLAAVQAFYAAQCDAFFAAADRHLRERADGSGELLAEFSRPSAGMFVWMRLRGVEGGQL